jgi:hypothetical protein
VAFLSAFQGYDARFCCDEQGRNRCILNFRHFTESMWEKRVQQQPGARLLAGL